ncbi:MAG: hypothetical protein AAGA05_07645 [Pseudomonadota bacterium]
MKVTVKRSFAAALALCAGPALAEMSLYEKSGDWNVFRNAATGGCMIENGDNNGHIVQMGVGKPDLPFGYVAMYSKDFTPLENGERRDIVIDLDGSQYSAVAIGVTEGITPGFYGGLFELDNPDLVRDLAEKSTLTVNPGEETSFDIDLDGTKDAMAVGFECLNAES